jgi:hypothetical protein
MPINGIRNLHGSQDLARGSRQDVTRRQYRLGGGRNGGQVLPKDAMRCCDVAKLSLGSLRSKTRGALAESGDRAISGQIK